MRGTAVLFQRKGRLLIAAHRLLTGHLLNKVFALLHAQTKRKTFGYEPSGILLWNTNKLRIKICFHYKYTHCISVIPLSLETASWLFV